MDLPDDLLPTEATLAARREALALDDADRRRLSYVAASVQPHWQQFLERLYVRLRNHKDTETLLRAEGTVERLLVKQDRYLRLLFDHPLDVAHARALTIIGLVHYKVGVTPQWYLATYSHFLCDHAEIFRQYLDDDEEAVATVVALIKSVFYDVTFVLDAYGEGERQVIRKRREEALAGGLPRGSGKAGPGPAADHSSRVASVTNAPHVRLTSEEVNERRRFLGITDDDLRELRNVGGLVRANIPAVLDDFYDFIRAHPDTQSLVQDDTINRLKKQVSSYWLELVQGEIGRPYAASRMRVGLMHERIGLSLQWYLSGLARQLVALLQGIGKDGTHWPAVQALIKVVVYDLTFVVDAYMEARSEALRRTAGYAGELIAGLTSAVAVVDRDHRIMAANPAMIDLVRRPPELVYRQPVQSAIPIAEIDLLLTSAQDRPDERQVAFGSIGARRFRVTAVQLSVSQDMPSGGCALILDDISDLVRLAEDHEDSQRSVGQLIQAVDAVLWELDPETMAIVAISRAVQELTGRRDMYYLGRSGAWIEAVAPQDRTFFLQRLQTLLEGNEASVEHRIQHANGEQRWVCSRVSVSRKVSGERVWHGVTVDTTDLKRAEARRLESIGTLAASIAHHMNNSLMSISGNVELHAQEIGGRSRFPLIQNTLAEVTTAATLTNQLLAFARKQDLRPQRVDCAALVRETATSLRALFGTKLRVALDIEPDTWPVFADPSHLASGLVALVENAAESSEQPVEVTIILRNLHGLEAQAQDGLEAADWVEIAVSDDGPGMDPDVRQRATDPFYTTKSDEHRHFGLGLSMVHGFATQSGGLLLVDSWTSIGTTIRVRLPRLVESAGRADHDPGALRRILVVDDNPAVRRIISRALKMLAYEVAEAEDGMAAIRLLKEQPFDTLLCDVRLGPGPDGFEVARAAEATNPGVRVIMMSGYTGSVLGDRLRPHHAYLAKPFSIKSLTDILTASANAGAEARSE